MDHIGTRVRVFWDQEDEWFEGVVTNYNSSDGTYDITYDDGDEDVVDSLTGDGVEIIIAEAGKENTKTMAAATSYDDDDLEADKYTNDEYTEGNNFERNQDNLIDQQNEAITSSLQKALEEININALQQEQDDQEEWLQEFFETQRAQKELTENDKRLLEEVEEDYKRAAAERKEDDEEKMTSNDEKIDVKTLFIDNFTKAVEKTNKEQQVQLTKNGTSHRQHQPPATTGQRRFNAASEGCALLQGSVLSAKSLPGSEVEIMNPFVKVLFVEAGSKNIMLRCKTPIHMTEVVEDTHDPAWVKSKFSMELIPPNESWSEIGGDIMFTVYDVNPSGQQVFIGQASVSLKELISTEDEVSE